MSAAPRASPKPIKQREEVTSRRSARQQRRRNRDNRTSRSPILSPPPPSLLSSPASSLSPPPILDGSFSADSFYHSPDRSFDRASASRALLTSQLRLQGQSDSCEKHGALSSQPQCISSPNSSGSSSFSHGIESTEIPPAKISMSPPALVGTTTPQLKRTIPTPTSPVSPFGRSRPGRIPRGGWDENNPCPLVRDTPSHQSWAAGLCAQTNSVTSNANHDIGFKIKSGHGRKESSRLSSASFLSTLHLEDAPSQDISRRRRSSNSFSSTSTQSDVSDANNDAASCDVFQKNKREPQESSTIIEKKPDPSAHRSVGAISLDSKEWQYMRMIQKRDLEKQKQRGRDSSPLLDNNGSTTGNVIESPNTSSHSYVMPSPIMTKCLKLPERENTLSYLSLPSEGAPIVNKGISSVPSPRVANILVNSMMHRELPPSSSFHPDISKFIQKYYASPNRQKEFEVLKMQLKDNDSIGSDVIHQKKEVTIIDQERDQKEDWWEQKKSSLKVDFDSSAFSTLQSQPTQTSKFKWRNV